MNTTRLGKHQKALLDFLTRNRGWQSMAESVKPQLLALEQRGLIKVSWTTMQALKPREHAIPRGKPRWARTT